MLYTVRSERLLMEELDDNILFRWFVGWSLTFADAYNLVRRRNLTAHPAPEWREPICACTHTSAFSRAVTCTSSTPTAAWSKTRRRKA